MAGTYKEILGRFKKDLGNTYQAQKNIVDVSQKYIGLLENAEGGSGGGIDYSETEQDTGLKWIDGKTIYQKTINTGALTNNTDKHVDHNITGAGTIVKVEGVAIASGSTLSFPICEGSSYCQPKVQSTYINLVTSGNYTGFTDSYVTVYYTKA